MKHDENEAYGDESAAAGFREQTEIKPEGPERYGYEVLDAEDLDKIIHNQHLPAVWRKIAKVTYYWPTPDFQLYERAGIGADFFLEQIRALLGYVEGEE